jgi:hypothetical protein
VAVGRARPPGQERGGREQPPHAADPPAVPGQRVRPHGLDAAGLRWFAEYQPFTPFIETLRGLLMGTPIGNSAMLALAWCALLALTGYCWAMKLYNRDPARWARPGPPEYSEGTWAGSRSRPKVPRSTPPKGRTSPRGGRAAGLGLWRCSPSVPLADLRGDERTAHGPAPSRTTSRRHHPMLVGRGLADPVNMPTSSALSLFVGRHLT